MTAQCADIYRERIFNIIFSEFKVMIKSRFLKLHRAHQHGATLIEYCQIMVLILLIAAPGIKLIGHRITEPLCKASTPLITTAETQWIQADGSVGSKTKCKSRFGFTTYFEIRW